MKKKSFIVFALFFLLLVVAPLHVPAAAGGSATGAKLPNYKKTVTINVAKNNFSKEFTKALELAKNHASNTIQYKIVLPKGTYEANHTYRIPSNTWVYARGTVLKRTSSGVSFLACEPYHSYRNIKIEGGTWDTTGQPSNFALDDTLIRFAHVKNMILKDMTVKCRRGGHIIEVGDMNGLTITGCKLIGNNVYRGIQPKEAIQLDVATVTAMRKCTPYNGKGCHNVVISNNIFSSVGRGIGSHSVLNSDSEAMPYTNITIKGNTFQKLKGEAVFLLNWKACTIKNNRVTSGKRTGIYLEGCTNLRVTQNTVKKISAFTGDRGRTYGTSVSGVLLRFSNGNYIAKNTLAGSGGSAVLLEGDCKNNSLSSNKKY